MNVTYFKNGIFHSMDEKEDIFSHMLAIDGKIVFTSLEPIPIARYLQKKNVQFNEIDLANKAILPSFCDAHVHFNHSALHLNDIQLDKAKSFKDFIVLLQDGIKKKEIDKSPIIYGMGWDSNNWSDRTTAPSKDELPISNIPLLLFSKDYHSILLNQSAIEWGKFLQPSFEELKLLGIIPEQFYQNCIKDQNGNYTGIFVENAMKYIVHHSNQLVNNQDSKVLSSLSDMMKILNSYGITAVTDCSSLWSESSFRYYQKFENDDISVRNCVCIPEDALDRFISLGLKTGMGNDVFKIGGLKIIYDGSLGSKTGYMYAPYASTNNYGEKNIDTEHMHFLIEKTLNSGIGLTIHGIGDKACSEIIEFFESARNLNTKIPLRIEHAQTITSETIEKAKNLNIEFVMQPVHIDQDINAISLYLKNRVPLLYRFRSLLDNNIFPAFSTDLPIADPNPFLGIFSAITHKGFDKSAGKMLNPLESISLFDAIKSYTFYSHKASLFPHSGILKEGYYADFIICDSNPFLIKNSDDLLKIKIQKTFFQGKQVYENSNI